MQCIDKIMYDETEFMNELDELTISFNPETIDNSTIFENKKQNKNYMKHINQLELMYQNAA